MLRTAQELCGREGAAAAHHAVDEGAAPAPARRHAAIRAAHLGGGRPRGGQGRRPATGRSIPASICWRSKAIRRAARCRSWRRRRTAAGRRAAVARAGNRARARGRRRRAGGVRARGRRGPDAARRADQSRLPAARDRAARRGRARLPRRARLHAATRPRCTTTWRFCWKTWAQERGAARLTGKRCAATRRWRTATTTSHSCARSSAWSKDAIRHMAQYRRLSSRR